MCEQGDATEGWDERGPAEGAGSAPSSAAGESPRDPHRGLPCLAALCPREEASTRPDPRALSAGLLPGAAAAHNGGAGPAARALPERELQSSPPFQASLRAEKF